MPIDQASKDVYSHLKNLGQLLRQPLHKPWHQQNQQSERELKRITDPIPAATKRTILRSQETGWWLQTPPSYANGICLSEMEFRDALHLRY